MMSSRCLFQGIIIKIRVAGLLEEEMLRGVQAAGRPHPVEHGRPTVLYRIDYGVFPR